MFYGHMSLEYCSFVYLSSGRLVAKLGWHEANTVAIIMGHVEFGRSFVNVKGQCRCCDLVLVYLVIISMV